MSLRTGLATMLTAALALGLGESRAEAQADFRDDVSSGVQHYKAGRYNEAIRAFRSAYAIKPRPELLYNIARCQEKSGQIDLALATYREFLLQQGTTADLRAKVLDATAALQVERASRGRGSGGGAAPPSRHASPGGGTSDDHLVEWILVGGGGFAVATGLVFGALAVQEMNRFEDATERDAQIRHRDNTNQHAIVADVAAGLGIVAMTVGLVFLLTDDGDTQVAVTPAAGGTGVALAGRF